MDFIDIVQDEDIIRILTADLTSAFAYFEKMVDPA